MTEPTADRIPPGQKLTDRFPVLHYGPVPRISKSDFRLRLHGEVEQPSELTWEEFQRLPRVEVTCDIHCVTHWSKLDTVWAGVAGRTIVELARPKEGAGYAIVQAWGGFEANLKVEDLLQDDVLFADTYDGRELTADHGGPLRLVVPHLYFWKSAKWVTGVEFARHDRPGFWERHGYHLRGDPWKEERYS